MIIASEAVFDFLQSPLGKTNNAFDMGSAITAATLQSLPGLIAL
jgi:hypothetical protein